MTILEQYKKEVEEFKASYIRLLESVLEELPDKVKTNDKKDNKYFKKYGFDENDFATGHNQCALKTKSIILKAINEIKNN